MEKPIANESVKAGLHVEANKIVTQQEGAPGEDQPSSYTKDPIAGHYDKQENGNKDHYDKK